MGIIKTKMTMVKVLAIVFLIVMGCTQTSVFAVDNELNVSDGLQTQHLFQSRTTILGRFYAMCRIPGIVVADDGTIIAYCEARYTSGDRDPIDILMRRSLDGGISWEEPVRLVDGVSTNTTMGNPVMIAEKNSNTVHFLYTKDYSEVFYMKSSDSGETWDTTETVNLTPVFDGYNEEQPTWESIATGPGHGIELENGRLLVPFWLSESNRSWARTSIGTIYSDDGGGTWKRGEIIHYNDRLHSIGEPVAVQLHDGSVMMNIRCGANDRLRAVSISPDGISNWSEPYLDSALPDPQCFGSITSLPKSNINDKDRLLFVNVRSQTAREHLTVRMSEDDGETWPYSKTIKLGGAAYSDISVGPDGKIYVLYEDEQPCSYLTMATFDLDWLMKSSNETHLEQIIIDNVDLSPSFMSEIFDYEAKVDADAAEVDITPVAFPDTNPIIKVNGQSVNSGSPTTVSLTDDKTRIMVEVSDQSGLDKNVYNINISKKALVTKWKFEKTHPDGLYDSSGMENCIATMDGVEYVPGYIGKSVKFDNSHFIDAQGIEDTRFGTGDFTVTAWINPDVIDATTRTLFWYGNTESSNMSQWWVRTKGFQNGKAKLEFSTGEKTIIDGVVSGGETFTETSRYFLAPGEWHHIAVQRIGGVTQIFVDGQLEARKGATPKNVSKGPLTNLYIGRAKTGAERNWIGLIDEIRMYNYGLTAEEVKIIADQKPVDTTALVQIMEQIWELNEEDYSDESWSLLQSAIAYAEKELENDFITQEGIDMALDNLNEAYSQLSQNIHLTYHLNGVWVTQPESLTNISKGTEVTLAEIDPKEAEEKGLVFLGWAVNGGEIIEDNRLVVEKDTYVYAQWGIRDVLKFSSRNEPYNGRNRAIFSITGINPQTDKVTLTYDVTGGRILTGITEQMLQYEKENRLTMRRTNPSEIPDSEESDIYTIRKVVVERNGAVVDVTDQLNARGRSGSILK